MRARLAAERLTEFARQWRMKRDADPDGAIYSIHFDRDAEPAVLNINDVDAVLTEVERLRALVSSVTSLADRAQRKGYDLDPYDVLAITEGGTDG